jgi:gamma-glutamyltranspeptidase
MNAQAAVDAPRTHMQWLPDQLEYEPHAFAGATSAQLEAMGYMLRFVPQWGSAQAIVLATNRSVARRQRSPHAGWLRRRLLATCHPARCVTLRAVSP